MKHKRLIIGSPYLWKTMMILFLFCSSLPSFAQNRALHGVVLDTSGEPVIGANVRVDGSTRGTVTGLNGEFDINVSNNEKLTISFIGYLDAVISVGNKRNIKVILKEDTKTLDEVVVVGYGVQKKATLTGAVSAVTNKEITVTKNENVVNMLTGKIPGVRISQNSSQPGEFDNTIDIRGMGEPLIVVDGIPRDKAYFSRMDANEIESVSVLKDASAAIYGIRAANGVILVTTKQAKEGKAKIEYSGSYTQKFVGLQPKMMSIEQWSEAIITNRHNDGLGDDDQWIKYAQLAQAYKGGYIDLSKNPNPIPAFGDVDDYVFMDTNWQDVLFGNSGSTQHN